MERGEGGSSWGLMLQGYRGFKSLMALRMKLLQNLAVLVLMLQNLFSESSGENSAWSSWAESLMMLWALLRCVCV